MQRVFGAGAANRPGPAVRAKGAILVGAVLLVGCAGTTTSGRASATSPTTTRPSGSTVAPTSPVPTTRPPVTVGPTTTTAAGAAQNLTVTEEVRTQLLATGAAMSNLPTSDFVGLVAGKTYYAYDPVTTTYWAGAGLVPKSTSLPAQVSTQDDGSYRLFERPNGGTWKGYNVGFAGIAGSTCPVTVPASVLALWGWPAGGCRPR